MSDEYNPWEADLDTDEDTGEVILPPGYTGRSGNPRAQAAARARGVGQIPMSTTQALQPATPAPAGPTAPPNGTTAATPPANGPGPAVGPAGAGCPPCPPCPSPPGRLRSPDGFPVGLVIGLGLVGSVLWWAGKMLGDVGDEDDLLDALPSSVPKMLPSPRDDEIEGEVVEDPREE